MKRFAVLSVGFRPWFLSMLVAGVVLFGLWGWVWFSAAMGGASHMPTTMVISDWRWHAHEMIFGLGVALLAGFLLTAVQNWTGQRMMAPVGLLAIVLLWWTARVLIFLGGMGEWLGFVLSAAVPLWVAVVILLPIVRHRQWRNLIFPAALTMLSILDVYFRARINAPDLHAEIAWAGVWPLVAVVLFMAQRVIPAFTGGITGQRDLDLGMPLAWMSGAGPFLLLFLGLIPFPLTREVLLPVLALAIVFFGVHALGRWWDRRVLREPMLLVLFVGYLLVLSGILILVVALSPTLSMPLRGQWLDAGIHALGLGILGVFGPGMLLRVSAGHTGRNIHMTGLLRGVFIAAVLFWFLRVGTLGVGFHAGLLAVSAWGMAGVYLALLLSIVGWLIRPRAAS
ncbi:MAG TPA: NnrS family protein [Halothiobacillus sp.]|nr:NnrS family protein [Halothiobacillus sp.]